MDWKPCYAGIKSWQNHWYIGVMIQVGSDITIADYHVAKEIERLLNEQSISL